MYENYCALLNSLPYRSELTHCKNYINLTIGIKLPFKQFVVLLS